MKYRIHIVRSAEKEIDRLPFPMSRRIKHKILSLEQNPHPRGSKKLMAREQYRLRVSDYRILYDIDDSNQIVTIFAVGHRSDVYR